MERIIFDLDNTIISNVDFNVPVKRAFEDVNVEFTNYDLFLVQKAIARYEYTAKYYDEKKLLKLIRKVVQKNIPDDFMHCLLFELEFALPEEFDDGVYDILEYLKGRYELCVLTNWFTEVQKKRLENAYLLDYFQDVYGGEVSMKPSRESFVRACGNVDRDKCLMVGDSLNMDYLGAKNAGINAILLDKDNKYDNYMLNINRINDIKELKKVL